MIDFSKKINEISNRTRYGIFLVVALPLMLYLADEKGQVLVINTLAICIGMLSTTYAMVLGGLYGKTRKKKIIIEASIVSIGVVIVMPVIAPQLFLMFMEVGTIYYILISVGLILIIESYFKNIQDLPATAWATKKFLLSTPIILLLLSLILAATVLLEDTVYNEISEAHVKSQKYIGKRVRIYEDLNRQSQIKEDVIVESMELLFENDGKSIRNLSTLFSKLMRGENDIAGLIKTVERNKSVLKGIKNVSKIEGSAYFKEWEIKRDMNLEERVKQDMHVDIWIFNSAYNVLLAETLYYVHVENIALAKKSLASARKIFEQVISTNVFNMESEMVIANMIESEMSLRQHLAGNKKINASFFEGYPQGDSLRLRFSISSEMMHLTALEAMNVGNAACLEPNKLWEDNSNKFICANMTILKALASGYSVGALLDIHEDYYNLIGDSLKPYRYIAPKIKDLSIKYQQRVEEDGIKFLNLLDDMSGIANPGSHLKYHKVVQNSLVDIYLFNLYESVLAYKKKYGIYPANIEDILKSSRLAFYDLLTAKRKLLVYKKLKGKIIIYSVGPDGVDDGGIPMDDTGKGDRVLEMKL